MTGAHGGSRRNGGKRRRPVDRVHVNRTAVEKNPLSPFSPALVYVVLRIAEPEFIGEKIWVHWKLFGAGDSDNIKASRYIHVLF